MGILDFLADILIFLGSPISWLAGLVLGFLFHKEMRKLGWGLLLFVVPGIGSLSAPSGDTLYEGTARFISVCCLAAIFYLLLEQRLYGKARRSQP